MTRNKYRAILFAPDGEFVTDYDSPTVEAVWDKVNNQGSRWVFFPLAFVIGADRSSYVGRRRIVDTPEVLESWRGRTVETLRRTLEDASGLWSALQS